MEASSVINDLAVNAAVNTSSSYWVTEGWRTRTSFTADDLHQAKGTVAKLPVRVRPDDSEAVLLIAIGEDIGRELISSRDPRSEAIVELRRGELSPEERTTLALAIGTGEYRYSRVIVVVSDRREVPTSLVEFLRTHCRPLIERGQVATCSMPYRESDAQPLQLS